MTEKGRVSLLAKRAEKALTSDPALNLPATKKGPLVDAIACTPKTLQQACTSDNIRKGFFEAGMIDSPGSERCADFENPVEKPTSISLEHQHRTKCLYHPFVVQQHRVGANGIREKQLHMIGYLSELVYNAAIAPDNNVSSSPGFETPLGIFKGRKNK